MEKVYIDYGAGLVELTEHNEMTIKQFLYNNFQPDFELKIRNELGKITERIQLQDLFTKPLEK